MYAKRAWVQTGTVVAAIVSLSYFLIFYARMPLAQEDGMPKWFHAFSVLPFGLLLAACLFLLGVRVRRKSLLDGLPAFAAYIAICLFSKTPWWTWYDMDGGHYNVTLLVSLLGNLLLVDFLYGLYRGEPLVIRLPSSAVLLGLMAAAFAALAATEYGSRLWVRLIEEGVSPSLYRLQGSTMPMIITCISGALAALGLRMDKKASIILCAIPAPFLVLYILTALFPIPMSSLLGIPVVGMIANNIHFGRFSALGLHVAFLASGVLGLVECWRVKRVADKREHAPE